MPSLTAYDLRTEHRRTPLGIGEASPRLSWRSRASAPGTQPVASRIVLRDAGGEVWDSGWRSRTPVDGVPVDVALAPRTRYEWALQLRDADGEVVDAGASWFETGYLDAPLPGAWIERDPHRDIPEREFDPPVDDDIPATARRVPPAVYLRTGFTVKREVASARLYASARGIYRAYLNGARVGDDELSPGWTDYRDRVLYQTHDITELLRSGENAVGLALADGWWSGYIAFDRRRQGNYYGEQPAGWAAVEIRYTDGSTATIATDESWLESAGEIFYTDLLMGEYVDRRLTLDGWTAPGYDTASWGSARVADRDLSLLTAQIDEPIRVVATRPAIARIVDPEGRAIFDFGQNLVGRVRVDLGALPRDAKVVLRHGEILEDGGLYVANLRTVEARDVYVSAGEDENVFAPAFTVHGFRYVELSGDVPADLDVGDLVAEVLHNDFDWSGEVSTSSSDVDQLLSNIRWGQRGNFVAVPTDCPQRDERLGWLADAQVFLPTAALNADLQSFFSRWLRDVRYAQSAEGSFEDVAPVISTVFHDGAPAWGDGGVIIPWHLYRVYGDERMLRDSLPSMIRWVEFVERENPSLLWTRRVGSNYGDWLQIDAATPRAVLSTAYFAHSTTLSARAARLLGESATADRLDDLAARIRVAFHDAFVGEDVRIEGDTQTVYLIALAFDLLPEHERPAAGEHLARTVEEHDRLLTTGFVGVALLCPVLSEIGRDDLAFALLETDRYPSWLYSVRHGATTIWERWDGWTEHAGFQSAEMNSFNHYSLGSVGEWVYRYVAGLDQTAESVAYETLRIAPRLGGSLTSAHASYETPRGLARSEWVREGERASFTIEVPPGSTAHVRLPVTDARVAGTALQGHASVSDLVVSPAASAFTLTSGLFEIDGALPALR